MASVEAVREALMNAAKLYEPKPNTNQNKSQKISTSATNMRKTNFVSFESRLLNSFHTRDPVSNQISIAKFITADTSCTGFVMVRLIDDNLFRMYFRGSTPLSCEETYNLEDFACIEDVINKKSEIIQDDDDFQALSLLVQWKPLFTYIPDLVVTIPVLRVDEQVMAVVALSFKKKFPLDFISTKLGNVIESLNVLVPYAMTLQALHDNLEQSNRYDHVLDALQAVDITLKNTNKCTLAIGTQMGKLVSCSNIIIFTIDYTDNRLHKFKTFGKQKSSQWGCPTSECHEVSDFSFDENSPIGWAATNRKRLKINDSGECSDYNLPKKGLHSVVGCFCKNILCVPVVDRAEERPLVIELSDKEGGFTVRDVELAELFAQHVASVHTCAMLLNNKNKYYRRNSIMTKILLDIEPIKHSKVEQFLSQQRKISPSDKFSGPFLDFSFSIKNYNEWEMAGGILHAFTDLDLVSNWKIRRTTLIRFILSVQQCYRALPYHNWQHACSVTHFIYLLITKLDLVSSGYLTKLESFALIVSGLIHDIDHRGTNNRFQACTNSELFKLYNTQESIMERHHLAIGISILQREDCNILENLSENEYKDFIELMTWNVLATDIAKYLQTRETNFKLIRNLRKNHKDDKLALFSLMMTASDVNDCIKSWKDNLTSVKHILTEFFNQGDLEKEFGMIPMAMMDRNKAYIPEVEYKFLSGIVSPVYRELAVAFPALNPCVETLKRYEDFWEVSTTVFDSPSNWIVENKLTILHSPEMSEENLTKLKDETELHGIDRFSPDTCRRKTAVDVKGRVVVPRVSVAPAQDFKRMFTEHDESLTEAETTDAEGEAEELVLEQAQSKCCGCLRKKSNDPDKQV